MNDTFEKYGFYQRLKKLSFIDEIWLYGSRAKENHTEKSDIDIAICCPHASDKDWYQVLAIIEEADTLLKIDCVRFDALSENSELRRNILKDHVVLFKREFSMQEKINQKLIYLEKALFKLEEMVNEPVDNKRAQIDASIHRFEFCFELFWKTLKVILENLGQKASFPKEILKTAFQGNIIDQEEVWLAMLNDRNETSHVYDEQVADRIYSHIRSSYVVILRNTFDLVRSKFYAPLP